MDVTLKRDFARWGIGSVASFGAWKYGRGGGGVPHLLADFILRRDVELLPLQLEVRPSVHTVEGCSVPPHYEFVKPGRNKIVSGSEGGSPHRSVPRIVLTLSGTPCVQMPRSLAVRGVVDQSVSTGTVCQWKRIRARCAIAMAEWVRQVVSRTRSSSNGGWRGMGPGNR